jgi:hypothetical protein
LGFASLKENLLKLTVLSHVLPGTAPKLSSEEAEQALGGRFGFVGTILPPTVPVGQKQGRDFRFENRLEN